MMRSSIIVVLAAIMIGFVSVLVYRVSASYALGLGQLSMPAAHVGVASGEASPVEVEFIVQQCDIASSETIHVAAKSEVLGVPAAAVSSAIANRGATAESVPLPEERPVAPKEGFVMLSPSILYIP